MRKNAFLRFASVAGLLALAASPAAAQFTKYVALGDSLTASFQGLCLVTRHQEASYPNVIAGQLGISDFEQPLFGEGVLTANPAINKCLGFVVIGTSIGVGPVSDQLLPTNSSLARPFDNLGVPGATAGDLTQLTNPNPNGNTANRFAIPIWRNFQGSPLAGTSAVQQAASLHPDLVTIWAGNNDVLGALLSGVVIDGVTMTPDIKFSQDYTAILEGLDPLGATLVTLNIPAVTAVPFGTTIPPVVLNPATGQPVIVNGSPVPLLGPGNFVYPCPGGVPACPVPAGTLVTLQAQPLLQQGFGIPCAVAPLPQCNKPLPDGQFIPPSTLVPGVLLYPNEVEQLSGKVDQLNAIIAERSEAFGALEVDIHAIFNDIKANGYHIGGITLTTTFGTGGIFSADGFHPNNIGQMLVANAVIDRLNAAGNEIPAPNIAQVLFTPDLPPVAAAVGTPDLEELAAWTRHRLFELFPPVAQGVSVLEPRTPVRLPGPRPDEDGTRTVERPGPDRVR
jgi:lysophospholipase L1-like esterase